MTPNKKCSECAYLNRITAKFCLHCGRDLSSDSKSLNSKNCKECGTENNKEAFFCHNCGAAFQRQRHMPQKKFKTKKSLSNNQIIKKIQPKSSFFKYPLFILIGGLILIFVIVDNHDKKSMIRKNSPVQPTSQNFSLERNVMEVASKFACSCGTCGEEALETCSCGTAEQERDFIRQALESGNSVTQVIAAVNARYGHLKSEITGEIRGSNLNLNLGGQKQNEIFSKISTSTPVVYNKIATDQDRNKIFSHFECPCGQCGIPELKDCSCQHPKGATEVKLFVDGKIEDGKYTIAELVDMVDQKYGHKIR